MVIHPKVKAWRKVIKTIEYGFRITNGSSPRWQDTEKSLMNIKRGDQSYVVYWEDIESGSTQWDT